MRGIFFSNARPASYVVTGVLVLLILLPGVVFCHAIQPLLRDLRDKNPEVRRRALQAKEFVSCYSVEPDEEVCGALSKEDFRRLTDALLELLKDQDAKIREQALRYLIASTDARKIQPMARLLQDPDDDVRAVAAGAFVVTTLKDREIVKKLENLLRDKDKRVRRAAAASLVLNGTQQSLPLLRDAHNRETDQEVKELFSDVIGQLERRIGKGKSAR